MYYSLKYITYERFVEREGRSSIGKRRRRRSRERPKHKKGTVSVFHLPFPLEDFIPQVPYKTAFNKVNSKNAPLIYVLFWSSLPWSSFFDEKPRNCKPFLAKKPKSAPPQITRAFLLMFSYGVAHADYHFLIAEPPTLKSKQTLIWRQNLSIFWP